MKNLLLSIFFIAFSLSLYSCRETTQEKSEEAVEAIGEEIEEGTEEVGDEIEEGAREIEQEIDEEFQDDDGTH